MDGGAGSRAGGRAKKKERPTLLLFDEKIRIRCVFAWMVCWSVSSCLFLTLAYVCLSPAHHKSL